MAASGYNAIGDSGDAATDLRGPAQREVDRVPMALFRAACARLLIFRSADIDALRMRE